jgi:hypothetical protein
MGRARPLAQVEQLIGGPLDAEALGQGSRQQAGIGHGVGVVNGDVELVKGAGGWHRERALLIGSTAALAGAILPAQRVLLMNGGSIIRLPQRRDRG